MNSRNIYLLLEAVHARKCRGSYVSDCPSSPIWIVDDLSSHAAFCGMGDIVHMSVADICNSAGLSHGEFTQAFCLPWNAMSIWKQHNNYADYMRLILAHLCGLTEGLI